MHDVQRVRRIRDALQQVALDGLVCALPGHVLMTTGYWPVVGTSLSITRADGRQVVIVPHDEADLAQQGWAEVRLYRASSLDKLQNVNDAVRGPLTDALHGLGITTGRIGFERGPSSQSASYAAMHLFGGSIVSVLHAAAPSATLVPADEVLATLSAYKTPAEVAKIRRACRIAESAFLAGAAELRDSLLETQAAANFRSPLSVVGTGWEETMRADGYAFCMSGPNSALAQGAYARSRNRVIQKHDLVLTHCDSYADGYWTDITRTYCIGDPDDHVLAIYEAVLAARTAALRKIAPGARASAVDHAAREKLARRGFGNEFKHSAGHGVGFQAISSNARPRIHPQSGEILEPGMVFNLEPAVYIEGFGGIRHCDVVVVTQEGVEVLTPFQSTLDDLLITGEMLSERHVRAA